MHKWGQEYLQTLQQPLRHDTTFGELGNGKGKVVPALN
jgi:hypothetical protein